MTTTANPEQNGIPVLLTYQQVAEILGFNPTTVRRLKMQGRIACVKVGRAVRFRPEHVQEFLREVPATPEAQS